MNFDEVHSHLQAKYPSAVLGREDTKPDPFLKIEPSQIRMVLLTLRDELSFETLANLGGIDYPKLHVFCVFYHPASYTHRLVVALKAFLPRGEENPSLPSVSEVYRAANWLERETYDMFGIHFTEHPDHRRILCPEDWVGYPLRKDYKTPDYYNGMPVPLYFEDKGNDANTDGTPER